MAANDSFLDGVNYQTSFENCLRPKNRELCGKNLNKIVSH